MRKPLKTVKKNEKSYGHLNKGGVLPAGALTFTFSIVIFVTFLLLMFSNIEASAPASHPLDSSSYLSGAGSINETTNPIGVTSLSSGFSPLQWLFVGIIIVAGLIIVATLIPSWL
jgi:hypothetical protein